MLGCWLGLASAWAQGAFYRDAEGRWQELPTERTAEATVLRLAPETIGGGATLVVLDKPDWMVLDDVAPPVATSVLIAGQERGLADLEMGWTGRALGEIVLAVADAANPLDLDGLRVTLNHAPLEARRLSVEPLDNTRRQARITLNLAGLPPGRYAVDLRLTDLAPARNALTAPISFNSAPLLLNAGFEEADEAGKPVNWSPGVWSSDADTKYDISVKPGGAEGEKALCLTGLAGNLNMVCSQRTQDLQSGVTYVYTGQYRSENGCALTAIANRGGQEVDYLSLGLPATADWTPFTWEFTLQPHDYALIVVRSGNTGESWFDDLRVVPK